MSELVGLDVRAFRQRRMFGLGGRISGQGAGCPGLRGWMSGACRHLVVEQL